MPNFKPNLLRAAMVASGLVMTSSVALAQEANNAAAEEEVEVIQVTGIRGSLAKAQALKMENTSIVEAISAEDIGKLPDASIAESLARLPGLTAQRLDGRANVISIRGLSPDFTTATLNGREQVSVGDNRGVEFDQYPSELLSGAVVYKTPDAKLTAQAMGGTVDMQSVRPLAHGERTIAFGGRYEWNGMEAVNPDGDDTGKRLSFSYIDQFMDGTVGIAFGYAHMDSPNQEERWNSWGFPDLGNRGTDENDNPIPYVDSAGNAAPEDTIVIGGAKPYVRSSTLERDGYMGVLEYQPNDQLHIILDAYYSEFEDTQILRGIELPFGWASGDIGTSLQDGFTLANGLVTEGTWNNVMGQIRNDINRRQSELTAVGINTDYALNDDWRLNLDVSYSKAERQDWGLESYAGTGRGNANGATDTIGFVLQPEGGAVFNPGLDYSDYNLIRLGGALNWGNDVVNSNGQDGFINMPEIEDELSIIRLSAERYITSDFFTSVEFGVEYKEREKQKIDKGYYLRLKTYEQDQTELPVIPEEYRLGTANLGFLGMGEMVAYDSFSLFNDGAYDLFEQTGTDRATNTWTVYEDVTTAFAMVNFDTTVIYDMPFSGNFGVQVVYTDQYSDGLGVSTEDGQLVVNNVTGGIDYTEVLPSFNGTLELDDSMYLRLGVARTLARARLDQMNASYSYNFDTSRVDSEDPNESPWSGNGGNPELEPWMAWQYDLSYEYYLDDLGYFSVAAFYKDLENYVFDESVLVDFSQIEPPQGFDPFLDVGTMTRPENGEGGHVSGIEATASLTGEMFFDALEGFGIIVSGSITESEVKESADSDPTDLPGLSKKVLNTTVFYERSGFEIRLSSRYRSDFLGEVSGLSLSRNQVMVNSELVVDGQIAYHFTEDNYAPLDGLSILFQATNVTDEPFSTYHNGDARQVKDYQIYGRNFMAGFNYKF